MPAPRPVRNNKKAAAQEEAGIAHLSPAEKRKLTIERKKKEAEANGQPSSSNKKGGGKKEAAPKKTHPILGDDEEFAEQTGSPQQIITQETGKQVHAILRDQYGFNSLTIGQVRDICEVFARYMFDTIKDHGSFTFTKYFTLKRTLRDERYNTNPQIYNQKGDKQNRDNLEKKIHKPAHYTITLKPRQWLKDTFANIKLSDEDVKRLEQMRQNKKSRGAKKGEESEGEEEQEEHEEGQEHEEEEEEVKN